MASCSQCQTGGVNVFGARQAESQLRQYRKRGADKVTRLLLDALTAEGVRGLTLLDIGGGIGTIGFELLQGGVTTATEIEASPAYVTVARAEAARRGLTDRIVSRQGDFVALADETPAAGIVTLNRVICCYADMPALVGTSAAKATRLYGAVYPRDAWWVRATGTVGNLLLRLVRSPLRLYFHSTAAVDTVLRGSGLLPRSRRTAGWWQVVIYARPA